MRYIFGCSSITEEQIKNWLNNIGKYQLNFFDEKKVHNGNTVLIVLDTAKSIDLYDDIIMDGADYADKNIKDSECIDGAFGRYKIGNDMIEISNDFYAAHPVYYYINKGVFYFANDLRMLLLNPDVSFELETQACHEFCGVNAIWGENELQNGLTFFKGIFKLRPSSKVVFKKNNLKITTINIVKHIRKLPYTQTFETACKMFRDGLNGIVENIYKNNKIVLSFSGGLDSSAILASLIDCGYKDFATYYFGQNDEEGNSDNELVKNTYEYLGINGIINKNCNLLKINNINVGEDKICSVDGPSMNGNDSVYDFINGSLKNDESNIVLSGAGGDSLFNGTKFSSRFFYLNKDFKGLFKRTHYLSSCAGESPFMHNLAPYLPVLKHWHYYNLFWKESVSFDTLSFLNNIKKEARAYGANEKKALNKSKPLKDWHRRFMFDFMFPRASNSDIRYQNFLFCCPLQEFKIYEVANMIPPVFHYDIYGGQLGTYRVAKQILRHAYKDILPKAITEKAEKTDYGNMFVNMIKPYERVIKDLFGSGAVYVCELGIVNKKLFNEELNRLFLLINDPQFKMNTSFSFMLRIIKLEIWLKLFYLGRESFLNLAF